IVIPEGVTKIGHYAFDGCVELDNVVLPESLVEIGCYTFAGCIKLTSITIPENVTEIGCNAFDGCISLAEVTLPQNITQIAIRTFKDCSSLTKIVIPKGVTKIEGSAFKNCVKLADVNIPKGVTEIGWNVFENCRSLTRIVIPEGVTEIDDRVFEHCENLKSVKIPKSLKKIGSGAFRKCVELSDIKFSEDGIQIGDEAFKDCFKLPRAIFSTNKKEISRWEFYRRTYLRTVNIPDNIEEIGGHAFEGCSALAYISISKNVSSIGERIFEECPSLKDISVDEENKNYKSIGGILVNKNETKIVRVPAQKELGHFTIPETIREIESGAFEDCKNLLSLTIPAKVAKIVPDALWGCNNLEHIEVDENNPNYRSIEGVLYTKDGTQLIHYPRAKKTKEYILPGSVVTVLKGAVSNPHLKKVFIPGEVRLIEEQAFVECEKLEEAIIASSSVVVQPLGFWGCRSLKHLVILEAPKRLTQEADRYERLWRRESEERRERREFLYKPNFQTWGFRDCGLENAFVPLDINIRQGYYEGFCFSFHCFRKLFRYKVEPEKEGGKLICKVLKSQGPDHVQESGEINAEYRKDVSTDEVSVIDYHCTNEEEQEANLEQIKYLLATLSRHGRV
ncbi:MAG: leucine-rich repeat domain-containing protein, partial [Verrucomicrobia bacterium]|nr:leucine-rich repeat domain-containing protein [Verrucomicrobiota bacterium]